MSTHHCAVFVVTAVVLLAWSGTLALQPTLSPMSRDIHARMMRDIARLEIIQHATLELVDVTSAEMANALRTWTQKLVTTVTTIAADDSVTLPLACQGVAALRSLELFLDTLAKFGCVVKVEDNAMHIRWSRVNGGSIFEGLANCADLSSHVGDAILDLADVVMQLYQRDAPSVKHGQHKVYDANGSKQAATDRSSRRNNAANDEHGRYGRLLRQYIHQRHELPLESGRVELTFPHPTNTNERYDMMRFRAALATAGWSAIEDDASTWKAVVQMSINQLVDLVRANLRQQDALRRLS